MTNNKIKYYPVNNGDMSLISLKDNTTILIDCNIREGDEDSDGNSIYNVKEDLLKSIQKRNGNPFIDLFILSHPDEDHCRGFKKNWRTNDFDRLRCYTGKWRNKDSLYYRWFYSLG